VLSGQETIRPVLQLTGKYGTTANYSRQSSGSHIVIIGLQLTANTHHHHHHFWHAPTLPVCTVQRQMRHQSPVWTILGCNR